MDIKKDELQAQITYRLIESLSASKVYINNIVLIMPISLVVVNPDATIKLVNPGTCELLGYEEKELAGQSIEKVFGRAAAAAADIFRGAGLEKLIKEGAIKDKQMMYLTKRGEEIPMFVSGTVVRNENGKLRYIVVVAKDMREILKLEEEKRKTEIAAEKKERRFMERAAKEYIRKLRDIDKMKNEFLNITAHELKGPLMPVSAQVQLFLAGAFGKISIEQKKSLEMMLRNVSVLNKLVSDLLDITKIKSRKLTLVRKSVFVEEIIQEAVNDLKSRAQEQQITLSVNIDCLPKISADPKRIKQVLINLLDNALKFTPKKGKITIEAENKKDAILFIKIRDTGIGIVQLQDNFKKLFTPFFQIDTSVTREKKGTGLGLVICKGIVEAHGGKIWAESPGENKGSTFCFTLPLKKLREYEKEKNITHGQ